MNGGPWRYRHESIFVTAGFERLDQFAFDFDATGDFIAQTMFTRGGTAAYEPLNFEEPA